MDQKFRLLLLNLAMLAIIFSGQALAAESFTLDNGMQVVVIPNHESHEVVHMVWYKVGAADDPPAKSGLAHFVEHLTFGGTETYPERKFSRILEQAAGHKQNAFTTYDYTAYYQTVSPEDLPIVMKLEAARMTEMVITDESLSLERRAVIEERQEALTHPEAWLDQQMHAALYGRHPYGKPVLGWPREMRDLSREDALAFYRRWYAPNNAVLVVAGDITAGELKPLAKKYYGVIPPKPVPARRLPIPVDAVQASVRPVVIEDDQAHQVVWVRKYLAPSYTASATQHVYALQVLAEFLGGGPASRLHQSLVLEKELALEVGIDYRPDSIDLAIFSLYVVAYPEVSPTELAKAIDVELQAIINEGILASELAYAQEDLMAKATSSIDGSGSAAEFAGMALSTGRSMEDLQAWPERIAAVTADQVQEAAKTLLRSDRAVTGMILPTLSEYNHHQKP